ncbi:hypothetical protein GSI_09717 [Ganoderma sinense ZZ0214-1]|uniref:Uncharacterized protein n=1 Tax=Ganoderma sinense ZZ0214-1 TaxID=1077348 RepID=A0A2G8S333_9APHY|nr:hypothetical protein GSI_09717 [Ganoderma sinense ZZ0214-1]
MPSITARMQGLSLEEPPKVATTPQPDDAPPVRRSYPRLTSNPTQVNSRPLPTVQECRTARRGCLYYGFYAGELALGKMIIKCFPEELAGRDPSEPNLFLAGLDFIRDVTNRHDIAIHIAWVTQRNKDQIPSIELEVGETTFVVCLFPLEREAYMNRITQENVDMLAEFFGTKPSWWEIGEFTSL